MISARNAGGMSCWEAKVKGENSELRLRSMNEFCTDFFCSNLTWPEARGKMTSAGKCKDGMRTNLIWMLNQRFIIFFRLHVFFIAYQDSGDPLQEQGLAQCHPGHPSC